jgi:hypothetical protein
MASAKVSSAVHDVTNPSSEDEIFLLRVTELWEFVQPGESADYRRNCFAPITFIARKVFH